MSDENSPPEDVAIIMGMVPRGHRTAIHISPRAEEAIHDVVDYCINIGGRRTYDIWATLATQLRERYAIDISPATTKSWCMKYVLPNITIPRSYIMKAIVEKGRHLDSIGELLEVRDELKEAYEVAAANLYQHERDAEGHIVRTGSNGTELASLAKARLMATEKAMDELERYGIVPPRKSRGEGSHSTVDVNVNVAGAMGGMAGIRPEPMDATFRVESATPPVPQQTNPAPPPQHPAADRPESSA